MDGDSRLDLLRPEHSRAAVATRNNVAAFGAGGHRGPRLRADDRAELVSGLDVREAHGAPATAGRMALQLPAAAPAAGSGGGGAQLQPPPRLPPSADASVSGLASVLYRHGLANTASLAKALGASARLPADSRTVTAARASVTQQVQQQPAAAAATAAATAAESASTSRSFLALEPGRASSRAASTDGIGSVSTTGWRGGPPQPAGRDARGEEGAHLGRHQWLHDDEATTAAAAPQQSRRSPHEPLAQSPSVSQRAAAPGAATYSHTAVSAGDMDEVDAALHGVLGGGGPRPPYEEPAARRRPSAAPAAHRHLAAAAMALPPLARAPSMGGASAPSPAVSSARRWHAATPDSGSPRARAAAGPHDAAATAGGRHHNMLLLETLEAALRRKRPVRHGRSSQLVHGLPDRGELSLLPGERVTILEQPPAGEPHRGPQYVYVVKDDEPSTPAASSRGSGNALRQGWAPAAAIAVLHGDPPARGGGDGGPLMPRGQEREGADRHQPAPPPLAADRRTAGSHAVSAGHSVRFAVGGDGDGNDSGGDGTGGGGSWGRPLQLIAQRGQLAAASDAAAGAAAGGALRSARPTSPTSPHGHHQAFSASLGHAPLTGVLSARQAEVVAAATAAASTGGGGGGYVPSQQGQRAPAAQQQQQHQHQQHQQPQPRAPPLLGLVGPSASSAGLLLDDLQPPWRGATFLANGIYVTPATEPAVRAALESAMPAFAPLAGAPDDDAHSPHHGWHSPAGGAADLSRAGSPLQALLAASVQTALAPEGSFAAASAVRMLALHREQLLTDAAADVAEASVAMPPLLTGGEDRAATPPMLGSPSPAVGSRGATRTGSGSSSSGGSTPRLLNPLSPQLAERARGTLLTLQHHPPPFAPEPAGGLGATGNARAWNAQGPRSPLPDGRPVPGHDDATPAESVAAVISEYVAATFSAAHQDGDSIDDEGDGEPMPEEEAAGHGGALGEAARAEQGGDRAGLLQPVEPIEPGGVVVAASSQLPPKQRHGGAASSGRAAGSATLQLSAQPLMALIEMQADAAAAADLQRSGHAAAAVGDVAAHSSASGTLQPPQRSAARSLIAPEHTPGYGMAVDGDGELRFRRASLLPAEAAQQQLLLVGAVHVPPARLDGAKGGGVIARDASGRRVRVSLLGGAELIACAVGKVASVGLLAMAHRRRVAFHRATLLFVAGMGRAALRERRRAANRAAERAADEAAHSHGATYAALMGRSPTKDASGGAADALAAAAPPAAAPPRAAAASKVPPLPPWDGPKLKAVHFESLSAHAVKGTLFEQAATALHSSSGGGGGGAALGGASSGGAGAHAGGSAAAGAAPDDVLAPWHESLVQTFRAVQPAAASSGSGEGGGKNPLSSPGAASKQAAEVSALDGKLAQNAGIALVKFFGAGERVITLRAAAAALLALDLEPLAPRRLPPPPPLAADAPESARVAAEATERAHAAERAERLHLLLQCPELYDEATRKAVGGYAGDPARLALPDRFVREVVCAVPHCNRRIELLEAALRAPEDEAGVHARLSHLAAATGEVRTAPAFERLLVDIILGLANRVNAGARKAPVAGLRISALRSLMQSRAPDGQTFLRFVVKGLFDSVGGARFLALPAAFPAVLRARADGSKVNAAAVETTLHSLDAHAAGAEALMRYARDGADGGLAARLAPLLGDAKAAVARCRERHANVLRAYRETVSWLGEDPGATSPEQFFKWIGDFLVDFEAEVRGFRERKAKEERRAAAEAERGARAHASALPGAQPGAKGSSGAGGSATPLRSVAASTPRDRSGITRKAVVSPLVLQTGRDALRSAAAAAAASSSSSAATDASRSAAAAAAAAAGSGSGEPAHPLRPHRHVLDALSPADMARLLAETELPPAATTAVAADAPAPLGGDADDSDDSDAGEEGEAAAAARPTLTADAVLAYVRDSQAERFALRRLLPPTPHHAGTAPATGGSGGGRAVLTGARLPSDDGGGSGGASDGAFSLARHHQRGSSLEGLAVDAALATGEQRAALSLARMGTVGDVVSLARNVGLGAAIQRSHVPSRGGSDGDARGDSRGGGFSDGREDAQNIFSLHARIEDEAHRAAAAGREDGEEQEEVERGRAMMTVGLELQQQQQRHHRHGQAGRQSAVSASLSSDDVTATARVHYAPTLSKQQQLKGGVAGAAAGSRPRSTSSTLTSPPLASSFASFSAASSAYSSAGPSDDGAWVPRAQLALPPPTSTAAARAYVHRAAAAAPSAGAPTLPAAPTGGATSAYLASPTRAAPAALGSPSALSPGSPLLLLPVRPAAVDPWAPPNFSDALATGHRAASVFSL